LYPAIGVGLQDADISSQMSLGMLALAVARVVEHCRSQVWLARGRSVLLCSTQLAYGFAMASLRLPSLGAAMAWQVVRINRKKMYRLYKMER
jgi:hypothetical protein